MMFGLSSTDPYELDWGNFTPEGYDPGKKEAIHVFNFDITSIEKVDRSIVYSVGKIIWAHQTLPEDSVQKVVYDLRGQPLVLLDRAKKLKQSVLDKVTTINPGIRLSIEILI